jgi:hypothetical protein
VCPPPAATPRPSTGRARTGKGASHGALTDRDRRILALLVEHRVATADQIARVEFPCATRARGRLCRLAERGILARFRPYQRPGSRPWHYTVGPLGAAITAAATGTRTPRASLITEATRRIEHSPNLTHQLGVVEFFTLLYAAARNLPGAALAEWWSETTTAAECYGIIRPDGYGHWIEPTPHHQHSRREVRFFYEHDRGTEPLTTILAKIDKYAALTAAHPRITLPVLIEVPNHTRESNLHRALIGRRARSRQPRVLVATTNTDYINAAGHNPAEPVWWSAGTTDTRHRLVNLPKDRRHTGTVPR